MHSILPQEKNPALRLPSRELTTKEIRSPAIKKLVADMKSLLSKETHGVALAAVQVGEPVRLFVVSGRALLRHAQDKSPRHPKNEYENDESPPTKGKAALDQTLVYINPKLLKLSRGKKNMHEGCLSIRGFWGLVPRAEKATIRALDEEGTPFTRGASGFLAHIFQHEMDHLEGILYTDKATEVYEEQDTGA